MHLAVGAAINFLVMLLLNVGRHLVVAAFHIGFVGSKLTSIGSIPLVRHVTASCHHGTIRKSGEGECYVLVPEPELHEFIAELSRPEHLVKANDTGSHHSPGRAVASESVLVAFIADHGIVRQGIIRSIFPESSLITYTIGKGENIILHHRKIMAESKSILVI